MTKMSVMSIVASVLVGRTIKYSIMAWCAMYARGALRFFGVDLNVLQDTLDTNNGAKGDANQGANQGKGNNTGGGNGNAGGKKKKKKEGNKGD